MSSILAWPVAEASFHLRMTVSALTERLRTLIKAKSFLANSSEEHVSLASVERSHRWRLPWSSSSTEGVLVRCLRESAIFESFALETVGNCFLPFTLLAEGRSAKWEGLETLRLFRRVKLMRFAC